VGQSILRVAAVTAPVGASQAGRVNCRTRRGVPGAPVEVRHSVRAASRRAEPPPADGRSGGGRTATFLGECTRSRRLIRSSVDLDELLDEVLEQVFRNVRAERGLVMLFDDETGD